MYVDPDLFLTFVYQIKLGRDKATTKHVEKWKIIFIQILMIFGLFVTTKWKQPLKKLLLIHTFVKLSSLILKPLPGRI